MKIVLPQSITSVTKTSKILALILFVLLPIYMFVLGINKGKVLCTSELLCRNSQTNIEIKERRYPTLLKLQSIEIENTEFTSYRLPTFDGERMSDLIEITSSGLIYPSIYTVSSNALSEDNLFTIVNDEIWVINGQTNRIDVYGAFNFKFIKSINSPKENIGVLDSISCNETVCDLTSAFHQESGCSMKYYIKTNTYADILCSSMSGEFIPEEY